MTVLVYFSSENRSDESKQRSQHSASHSNTQWCFEWIGWFKDSMTHAQTSVSFLMNRPFEGIVWMNDSMTRLIKPLITCICAHYRQTNQICSKLFFLNQSKHILIFIQELCIYKTITFYDSSLVIKIFSKFVFFSVFFFLPSCSLLALPPGECPHPTVWEPLV